MNEHEKNILRIGELLGMLYRYCNQDKVAPKELVKELTDRVQILVSEDEDEQQTES